MNLKYTIQIENPSTHLVKVIIDGKLAPQEKSLVCYLPLWWPFRKTGGEAARLVVNFKAETEKGEWIYFAQTSPGVFTVDWEGAEVAGEWSVKNKTGKFNISYEVYCPSVNNQSAYLDGSNFLMGIRGREKEAVDIVLRFPPLWSKVSTSWQDTSQRREEFVYQVPNYFMLLESPALIGCHETDGFMAFGKEHELALTMANNSDVNVLGQFKEDLQKMVNAAEECFGVNPPYSVRYLFMLRIGLGTGTKEILLAHPRSLLLLAKEDYSSETRSQTLTQLAAAYIRSYLDQEEATVSAWGTEKDGELWRWQDGVGFYPHGPLWFFTGLSAFLGELLPLRSSLVSREDFLGSMAIRLNGYFLSSGKKFGSLEESFRNWPVELSAQEEFTSRYACPREAKACLVFWPLFILFWERGKGGLSALAREMRWGKLPIKDTDKEILGLWETWTKTTEDINFSKMLKKAGMELEWVHSKGPWIGVTWRMEDGKLLVHGVALDSVAFKMGLRRGEELVEVNNQPASGEKAKGLWEILLPGEKVSFVTKAEGRSTRWEQVEVAAGPAVVANIKITDQNKCESFFQFMLR